MFLTNGTLLQGGKYKIVRHISSGGFGNTYEGLDVNHNKRVAIKEFFVSSMCSRGGDSKTMVITDKSQTETIKRVRRKFIEEAQTLLIMKAG